MRSIQSILSVASLVVLALLATPSCKPKQVVAPPVVDTEVKGKTDAEISLAKNQLRRLLTDENLTAEELEQELAKIKGEGHTDPEVLALITQVESRVAQKRELQAQEAKARSMGTSKEAIVEGFGGIAKATNYDAANEVIDSMVARFESPDTPVLIIIAEEGGERDYDKPTTIAQYLEYVKMQKRHETKVEEIVRNPEGKITRLILRK